MRNIDDSNDIDEKFETASALKLLFKGYAAGALSGAIFYWPVESTVVEVLQVLLVGLLLYVSCLPLVLASVIIRNQVCRRFNLVLSKPTTIALGLAILFVLLVLAAKVFGLGRLLHGTA